MKDFWIVVFVIAGVVLGAFFYFAFDDAGNCNSDGMVWDYDRKECRNDCWHWNSKKGCIQLEEYVVGALDKCKKDVKCHNDVMGKVFPDLCFKYDSAYNLDKDYCDFEFEIENCYKLEGNWKYPEICKNKKATL